MSCAATGYQESDEEALKRVSRFKNGLEKHEF
jgi:hypothetical protein